MNILITRLQNIGDMLAFIPALRILRETLPEAKITLLTKHAGGVEIVKNCPYFDDIIIVRNRSLKEKIRLLRKFRKIKIDYFIISPQDLGRVPWALMGGAKKIIGYQKVFNKGKWKKEKLPFMINFAPEFNIEKTETENCATLVNALFEELNLKPIMSKGLKLEYSWFTKTTIQAAKNRLAELNILPNKFVAIAPYSKQSNKNWAKENWTELCKTIINQGYKIILIGGNPEAEPCSKLSTIDNDNIVSLAGELSLTESAYIIKLARLFTGPDSGPAFLATAVETPAVVLYGPADYRRWKPAEIAVPRIDIHAPDKRMNSIPVSEVCNAVNKLLK
ncbi:MAG: glycosyltransferase family 9 protein [Victivallaceae bacterium]|nr:glycosyltransferase family 9 protein [Victivallaceae bacterium]